MESDIDLVGFSYGIVVFKYILSKKKGVQMVTNENLKEAFAGESQANRRYLAYAK